jgi:hypothetical protein
LSAPSIATGKPDVAAEEQHRAGVGHPARHLPDLLQAVQHLLDLVRHGVQLRQGLLDLVGELRAAQLRQVQPRQVAGVIWARNALVEATAISGTGVGVEAPRPIRGDRRPVRVADRDDPCALLAACRTAMIVSIVSPDCEMADRISGVSVDPGSR